MESKKHLFAAPSPCNECPWRKDVAPGRFSSDRFVALQNTMAEGFSPYFACHKSEMGTDRVCTGYLLSGAGNNLSVRLAAAQKRFSYKDLSSSSPLYRTYREMALANGVREEDLYVEEICDDAYEKSGK